MHDYIHKRSAQRTKLAVPVILEEGVGMTRDISRSGIYLTTAQPYQPGDRVRFTLELEYAVPEGPKLFTYVGRIVRVEKLGDDEYGVASTIDELITLH
jgi:hypothetical protein